MHKLTDLQHKFTQNYIANGFNAYHAALDAGYSKSYAVVSSGKLIRNPIVKAQIDKAVARIDEKLEKKLAITIADKCKVLAKIINDIIPKDGSEIKRKYYGDLMKAVDMLNKMQGHYAPDKRVSVNVDATKEKIEEIRRQYKDY